MDELFGSHVTPNTIVNLPMTDKELNHTSRNRRGYHVYLSYFHYLFKKQTRLRGTTMLYDSGVWEANTRSDNQLVVQVHDIARLASHKWNYSYNDELRNGWRRRADVLNARPRADGCFTALPSWLDGNFSLEDLILKNLSHEWKSISMTLRNCLLVEENLVLNREKKLKFGYEKIKIGNHVLRKMIISPLLIFTIFGSPLFTSLLSHELVYESKKIAVIHIHSNRRMNDLFTFGGISCSEVHNKYKKVLQLEKFLLWINWVEFLLDM